MLQNTDARKVTYALKTYANYRASNSRKSINRFIAEINDNEVWVRLIGTFNAYNLLAIYGTAIELGLDHFEVLRLLSN